MKKIRLMWGEKIQRTDVILTFMTFCCLAAFCVAILAEKLFSLRPCVLCIYQRYILAGLFLSLSAELVFINRDRFKSFIRFLGILFAFSGFSLSSYHFGVEQHWWQGPQSCSANHHLKSTPHQSMEERFQAFQKSLQKQDTIVPRCDEVSWRIFGISATFWTNLFYAFILLLFLYLHKKRKWS